MAQQELSETPASSDFRDLLLSEFARRRKANAEYSLRAFARFLVVQPAVLSKLLAKKRRLSPTMFGHLADRLRLSPTDRQRVTPAPLARAKKNNAAETVTADYRTLTIDAFQVVSDWYHYALLELVSLPAFRPEPRWIARNLGISLPETQAAIERLKRLEFLKILPNGKWEDASGAVTTVGNPFSNIAFRNLQRQVLEKALVALDELPVEERDQSSMTMAIDSRKLPEARLRLKNFRRELCEYLKGDAESRDAVFNLSLSLYPLTPRLREGNTK